MGVRLRHGQTRSKPEDLLKEIFKCTFRGDPPPSASLEEITKKIEDARRPYLLVLDDVCNDETSDEEQRRKTWESVLAPFMQQEGANNKGSRILLTSRAQICLDTLGRCMDARARRRIKIVLNGINDTAQLKLLLMEEARKQGQTGRKAVPQELEEHLEKHVGKLHGSPLAARKFVSLSAPGKCYLKSNTVEPIYMFVQKKDTTRVMSTALSTHALARDLIRYNKH